MWIREALTDAPRGARLGIALGWASTALLAVAAVGIGWVVDALLDDERMLGPILVTVIAAILGAACGGIAEAFPGRIQAAEERSWRQRVLRRVLRLDAPTPPTPRGHPGQTGMKPAAKPGGKAGTAQPGRPVHPHAAGQPTSGDGAMVDAATVGVEKTANYRAGFLGPTLASFTSPLLVLIVWAVFVDALSALILAAFVALVPVVIVFVGKWLRRPNHEYRRREAQAANQYLEMLEGIGTMKVLGAAGRARDGFAQSARSAMRELGQLLARNQLMIIVNDGVFGLLMGAAAVALVLFQLAAGAITPGAALSGVLLTVLLQEPIDRVGRTFYVGIAGRTRRDQLEELLADEQPAAASTPATPTAGDLELREISVTLGDKRVLENVNLRIPSGTRVALVGPSGAGKTTLMRAIAGLTHAEGDVLVNGQPLTLEQRRALVSRVGQDPGILGTTVADNLRLVAPDADDNALWHALERAHLRTEVSGMPAQLEEPVGDRGAFLSGGQRRRLAIARSFLRDVPVRRPVLLLDEPTADLDRRTEAQVRASLAEVSRDRIVIQIAHRLDTTLDADLVIVLIDGCVEQVGTPSALRAHDGYYARGLAAGGEA